MAIFTRSPPSIRGKIEGFFMKKNLKKKDAYVWNGIDRIIFESKVVNMKKLSKNHINLLLNEIKFIKYI